VTLEEACVELKAPGVNADIDTIKKYNPTELNILEVEKNHWNPYRSILAYNRSREMAGTGA
jgi:hypothetical protein